MKNLFQSLLYFMTRFIVTICLAVVFSFLLFVATIMLQRAPANNDISHHDAIIVLTGGPGRIGTAFDLFLAGKAERLLISGVISPDITKQQIIDTNAEHLSTRDKNRLATSCCIDLDYKATTTEENALESKKWMDKNKFNSFILVTHTTHMPRSYINFKYAFYDTDNQMTLYASGIKDASDLIVSTQFWKYAISEYTKTLGSLLQMERHGQFIQNLLTSS